MELVLKKEVISNKNLCMVLGILSFIILTALGAFVRIPLAFTPVPLTLQTFFVMLGALFLGSRSSVVAQIGYISLGIVGLPIFSGAGSGILYLSGPTGGYILGFIAMSFIIGKFIKYTRDSFFLTLALILIADFSMLFCGALWLRVIFGQPFNKLMLIGFFPFVPLEIIKAFVACIVYSKVRSRVRKIF